MKKIIITLLSLTLVFFVSCSKDEGEEDDNPMAPPTTAPTVTAAAVAFTDLDADAGEIRGDITITKAASESSITHYVVYWSTDGTNRTTLIEEIAKTGSDVTSTIASNTDPTTNNYFVVVTKNSAGESDNFTNVMIVDETASIPVNDAAGLAFTDTDPTDLQIGGDIVITKAADESDVDSYVLYWSSDGTARETLIAEIAKTGADITNTIAANTTLTNNTNIIVVTKNIAGESATDVSEIVTDVIVNIVPNFSFETVSAWGIPDPAQQGYSTAMANDGTTSMWFSNSTPDLTVMDVNQMITVETNTIYSLVIDYYFPSTGTGSLFFKMDDPTVPWVGHLRGNTKTDSWETASRLWTNTTATSVKLKLYRAEGNVGDVYVDNVRIIKQ